MTYRGRIKNGVAVFDSPVSLPDDTRVRVEVESPDSEFWTGKTVDELANQQGLQSIEDLASLAIDWPKEESIDEFLALVREVRR